jgi:prepilin-type N-terminal cleavage/methylation domain-containing protein
LLGGSHRKALSLVELLVVIAIIGILLAIAFPAIQAAREAARVSRCKDNLKNIALAAQHHEAAYGSFPSGGWGWDWVGDPDRGFLATQPGGRNGCIWGRRRIGGAARTALLRQRTRLKQKSGCIWPAGAVGRNGWFWIGWRWL